LDKRGPKTSPTLSGKRKPYSELGSGRFFLAVGPAPTLALTGVFALAAVVALLATAFALARVLAFTSVPVLLVPGLLRLLVLVLILIRGAGRSPQGRKQSRSLNCHAGTSEQSRERGTCEYGLGRFRHFQALLLIRVEIRNTVQTLFPASWTANLPAVRM
jgi:hypothetical protein